MEDTISIKKQVQFESENFYHLELPHNYRHFDSSIFESGFHFGQFAAYQKSDKGLYRVVRDPLGIGKLFYTETPDGKLHFSNKFTELFPYKSKIFSAPPGALVELGTRGTRRLIKQIGIPQENNYKANIDTYESNKDLWLKKFRQSVDSRMNSLFTMLRELEDQNWSFFVALSGGLDSAIIATKAAAYLKNPIACTLDLGKSEDSAMSQNIAKKLGLKHIVFPTNEDHILSAIDEAPLLCQDYRDFNVHCAALNILLSKSIKQLIETSNIQNKEKVIVLTGDLMNEFTCDYEGEIIDGVEYYRLPRINKKDLQRILINGLDTSDREISVFNKYGLNCIQPFAILYDLYNTIPESLLQEEDPKKILNASLVDPDVLKYIPKVKLRAQVGSRESMGILGVCHSKGINNTTFRKNLLEGAGLKDGQIPIFAGQYDIENFDRH